MPRPSALAAGLLLGVSLWPLELKMLEYSGLPAVLEERFGAVLQSLKDAYEGIGWWILAIVIVPAILEEFFFRGFLFNALKARCSAWLTIGVSALLFGLSHVVLDGALGLERLLPSLMLGLILSSVCWRSGSLWPSLLQHVCHNTILLMVGLNEPGSTHAIPWTWLVGSGLGTTIGVFLLWQGGRGQRVGPVPPCGT